MIDMAASPCRPPGSSEAPSDSQVTLWGNRLLDDTPAPDPRTRETAPGVPAGRSAPRDRRTAGVGGFFSLAVNQSNPRVNREGESLRRVGRVSAAPVHSLVNRCPSPSGVHQER